MRIRNSKIAGLAFGVGLAIAASTIAASAGTVVLSDGTFSNVTTPQPHWGPNSVTPPATTTESLTVCSNCAGSDLGLVLEAVFTFSGTNNSPSAGQVGIDGGLQYNPSSGAITSLNVSADKYTSIAGGPLPTANTFRILLEQGGRYYQDSVTSAGSFTNSAWVTLGASGVHASDFTQICVSNCGAGFFGGSELAAHINNNAVPLPVALDFLDGNNGSILFGVEFLTGLLSNGETSTVAYDNLEFDLTTTPLPSTWTMLIAGFVGLGFVAYRGKKKGSAAIAAA
jgi:hypothetical protein